MSHNLSRHIQDTRYKQIRFVNNRDICRNVIFRVDRDRSIVYYRKEMMDNFDYGFQYYVVQWAIGFMISNDRFEADKYAVSKYIKEDNNPFDLLKELRKYFILSPSKDNRLRYEKINQGIFKSWRMHLEIEAIKVDHDLENTTMEGKIASS